MTVAQRGNKKDPLLSTAVVKVSFALRGGEARLYQEIYEGLLRDFDLTDAEVDAYIEANRERVMDLVRGRSEVA